MSQGRSGRGASHGASCPPAGRILGFIDAIYWASTCLLQVMPPRAAPTRRRAPPRRAAPAPALARISRPSECSPAGGEGEGEGAWRRRTRSGEGEGVVVV